MGLFGTILGGSIGLFALLSFVVTERTRPLVDNVLLNRSFVELGPSAEEEYKLWLRMQIFSSDILRFITWERMETLIKPNALSEYEKERYKDAFYRFRGISNTFIWFFWTTACLLFMSLTSLSFLAFFDLHFQSIIGLLLIIVLLLSLFSLTFATLIVKLLFISPKEEGENLKKEIQRKSKDNMPQRDNFQFHGFGEGWDLQIFSERPIPMATKQKILGIVEDLDKLNSIQVEEKESELEGEA